MTLSSPVLPRRGAHTRRLGRRGRFLALHGRARGVPALVIGIAVVAVVGWVAADWLVDQPWSEGPVSRRPVAVAAPLVAAVLASVGLGARDEELERSTAVPWRRFRLVHLAAVVVLIGVALTPTGLWEPQTYGAFEVVRNTFGFAGMLAAGAVVLGTRLAWIPALAYAMVVSVAAPKPLTEDSAWWTWPLQPWAVDTAAWAALVVFVAGLAIYVAAGARPSRDTEE